MNQTLQAGGNVSIDAFSGTVTVTHDIDPRHDINLTAFLLTEAGKVQGDSSIVFFNQPRDPNGAAGFIVPVESANTKTHRIDFDLSKIPAGISKIAVTLTEDNRNTFSTVRNLKAEVGAANGIVQLTPNSFNTENGIIVLELYIRNEQAKVRAVWQGFASGLDGLCLHYGVEVEEEPASSSESLSASPPSISSESSSPIAESSGVMNRIRSFLGFETPEEARERTRMAEEQIRAAAERRRREQIEEDMEKATYLIEQQRKADERRNALIAKHGSAEVADKIINKEFWQGQTKEQLKDSRGTPADVDQKVLKTKTKEIWKYTQIAANRYALKITLENNLVVGWEEQ
ncbi:MAG: TerD family protein [Methylococcales bacterium]|nr:TerD family protein [Methylococcales bacterium]